MSFFSDLFDWVWAKFEWNVFPDATNPGPFREFRAKEPRNEREVETGEGRVLNPIEVGEIRAEGPYKELTRLINGEDNRLYFRTTEETQTVWHGRQSTNSLTWVPIAQTEDELDEFLLNEAREGGIEGGEADVHQYQDDGFVEEESEEEPSNSAAPGSGTTQTQTLTQTRRTNLSLALERQEVALVITPQMLEETRAADRAAARAATEGLEAGGHVRPAHLRNYVPPPERRQINIELRSEASKEQPQSWEPPEEEAPEEPHASRWRQIREDLEE